VAAFFELFDPFLEGEVDAEDDQEEETEIHDGRWKEALQEIHVSIVELERRNPEYAFLKGSRGRECQSVAQS